MKFLKTSQSWSGIDEQAEPTSIMSKLPPTLPALMKAEKVQQKAHRVGFDWDDIEGPKAKIIEELTEMRDRISTSFISKNADYLYMNGRVNKNVKNFCNIF